MLHLTLLLALAVEPAAPAVAPGTLTLERVFADPPLGGRPPTGVTISPDGKLVAFLRPNEADSDVLDLWGADLPSGAPRLLVATADLLGGKEQKLTEAERMALERKRISKRGITSYLWCGKKAPALVFPFSGDLYLARLGAGAPEVLRLTTDEGVPEMDPVCDDAGAQIATVKKGDVVVIDVTTKKAHQLTRGAGPTRTFGLAEFIAAEEMGRTEGMWWSPDGTRMVVFEVDESTVGVKTRARIFADRTEMEQQRYPAAGEKNAVVTAWLVEVKTGKKTRLQVPAADGYLPRAGFFPDGALWIEWQSRDQTVLKLFEGNARGVLRQILEETDPQWVELHDDLEPLADGKRLVWSTEQSGHRQLVVVDRASGARSALTAEPEPVDELCGVDEERGVVFFTARRDRGRERHLFAQPLAGGPAVQLTRERGFHAAVVDDTGRFFVHTFSDFGRPPMVDVRDASGTTVQHLDDNPATELFSLTRSTPQWLDVKADDGTLLNAVLLPPTRQKPGVKYPVIADIYGGPTGADAGRFWQRSYLLWTFWNQQGYGVLLLDVRGSSGRDRAFGRAHYRKMGVTEVADTFAAARQLDRVPWVDVKRLGLFGWSYGGFLAARAALDGASPFSAHAAVAPVVDFALYDTHYTERYLGMPEGGKAPAYVQTDLTVRAKLLNRPLLLVHGTADDNVLFENTLQLTEALQQQGKLFSLMIYPGKAHGIAGKEAQLHVFKTITAFFDQHLRPRN
ncbi:MAG: S9 family peptidase [Deltaproteobacteria bacterium]|nr:S9 family peptidase [Deltaproteobacteria bacterium]